jgi:hypothetical protein
MPCWPRLRRLRSSCQWYLGIFFTRIRSSHPKTLFTDFGGEICSDEFDHFLLANDVQHVVVPKGEHHANGPAEEGIDDIDRMTKAIMADKNIPSRF